MGRGTSSRSREEPPVTQNCQRHWRGRYAPMRSAVELCRTAYSRQDNCFHLLFCMEEFFPLRFRKKIFYQDDDPGRNDRNGDSAT
jgi:hypothetical protein